MRLLVIDDRLRAAWAEASAGVGAQHDESLLVEVVQRYDEPHREYHGLAHLAHVVSVVSSMQDLCEDFASTVIAAFFHDVVYVIGRSDNETASAQFAGEHLRRLGAEPDAIAKVEVMIVATDDHVVPNGAPADTAVLLDADLAILGTDTETYDHYVERVRREYAAIPDDAWRVGRAAVLESFLRRDRIFLTPRGHEWEVPARSNLQRELSILRG